MKTEKHGVVTDVEGNMATVAVKRDSACIGNCASSSCAGCAAIIKLTAENRIGAKVGDYVAIEIEDSFIGGFLCLLVFIPICVMVLITVAIYLISGTAENVYTAPAVLISGLVTAAAVYAAGGKRYKKNSNSAVIVRYEDGGGCDGKEG